MPDIEITLRDDAIRLGQLLKLANVVQDGVEARAVIENHEVTVNGRLEHRRGTQVRPGDVVEFAGERIVVRGSGA